MNRLHKQWFRGQCGKQRFALFNQMSDQQKIGRSLAYSAVKLRSVSVLRTCYVALRAHDSYALSTYAT